MNNDQITSNAPPAVDIHSIALKAARRIAQIDPAQMAGGAVQALARIQIEVREAIEEYSAKPMDNIMIPRSLYGVADPNEWAANFLKAVPTAALGKVEEGQLATWFANSISHGFDIASARAVKRLCLIQGCEDCISDPGATPRQKTMAKKTKDALLDRKDHGLALVDRRELDEAKVKPDRAVRALQRSGFQDLGGEEWQPPVNERARELQCQLKDTQDLLAEATTALTWNGFRLKEDGRTWVKAPLMTVWPERSIRLTFTHPTIGDERFAPKVQKAMIQAAEMLDDVAPTSLIALDNGIFVKVEAHAMLDRDQVMNGYMGERAELSAASANLEGVDIDAAHKMVEDSNGVLVPESSLMTAHLKTAGIPVGEYVDNDTALKMVHMPYSEEEAEQEREADQSQDESKANEQAMQEKQEGTYTGPERRSQLASRERWPNPDAAPFTLKDENDPMNLGNRHNPLRRRHND